MLAPTPNVVLWPDAARFPADTRHALAAAFRTAGYTLAVQELAIDDQVAQIDSDLPTWAAVTVYKTGAAHSFTGASPQGLARELAAFIDNERYPTSGSHPGDLRA
ncbi:hypothetical protein [Glycomyces sp. YM15]|uniref:hypothetical protein n=1 Tax=Glycomyces sp. YM15 TaxID=2800446 RepID=UPI001963A611|nr:hypothetical protein [Glycomyces sp. YM15]